MKNNRKIYKIDNGAIEVNFQKSKMLQKHGMMLDTFSMFQYNAEVSAKH